MQPPTDAPALPNGVHFMGAVHSVSSVHIVMPVQVPAATQAVCVIVWEKLPQATPPTMPPSPIVAPGAQHTGVVPPQSATGSSHCQSVKPEPVMQAVAMGWQALGVALPEGVSQQCCVLGVQYSFAPPSMVALNGQKMVPGPASSLGGCSVVTLLHSAEPPVPVVVVVVVAVVDDVAPPFAEPVVLLVPPPLAVPVVVAPPEPVLPVVDAAELVAGCEVVPVVVFPVLVEPQATRLTPAVQPSRAPAISHPFFMIQTSEIVRGTIGDFTQIVAASLGGSRSRNGARSGAPGRDDGAPRGQRPGVGGCHRVCSPSSPSRHRARTFNRNSPPRTILPGTHCRVCRWSHTRPLGPPKALRLSFREKGPGVRLRSSTPDHLSLALQAASMHTWSWDIVGGGVAWSDGIEALVGLPPGAFEGTFASYERILHPDDRAAVVAAIQRAVADERATYEIEHRIISPDGVIRWLACRGQVVRNEAREPTVMLGVVWDVSARKAAEARLGQLVRVSAVVTAINQEIVRVRDEGELFLAACRIAVDRGGFLFAWVGIHDEPSGAIRPVARWGHEDGYLDEIRLRVGTTAADRGPTATAIASGAHAVVDDVEQDPRMAPWRAVMARHGYRSSAAFPLRREGRTVGALNIYCGERHGFAAEELSLLDRLADDIGFALDALRRDERRRTAEERYRLVVEHATDGIFLADRSFRFVEVNGAACTLLGYSREELLALRVHDLFPPDEAASPSRLLDPERVGMTLVGERRVLCKDGRLIDVEVDAKVLPGGMQQAFVRDIRERRELQAQLLLADRLASLGQLAAGIAHEVNNPLAYTALNIEHAQRALRLLDGAPPTLSRALAESSDGVERVRVIVRELDAFGRGEEQRLGPVDVNRALDAAIRIADSKIRHRARLVRQYQATTPVHANELRLGQVFVNLLVNAGDAIPDHGLERHEIRVRTAPGADGRVIVEVSDTGAGIAPEVRGRIFDPFFTTKPVGSGTGLGLSICHRIVTMLGGEISVESELGRGTTFRIALPASHGDTPSAAPAVKEAKRARRARVLVVDDERAIARVLQSALTQHDVTVATDGDDARTLGASGAFDAVICDLLMPDLSGSELYDLLRAGGKGLERRIVFMTGGAFAPRAQAFLAGVPNRCLEKPFSLTAVEEAVQAVLDENA
jgi:PAS domain S-box-containing protein